MKKEITQNDEYFYEVKYVISKKKYAIYSNSRDNNYKSLSFFKNRLEHRLCNEGPQYRSKILTYYIENDMIHNLYGYALIDIKNKQKEYWINNEVYAKSKFLNYITIYNNLSYKRTY